jgi:hypothetical protein
MIRNCSSLAVGALILALTLDSAYANTPTMDQWFSQATAYNWQGNAQAMTSPDFLCGKTFDTLNCHIEQTKGEPAFSAVWQLLRYDRKHHIALAHATTDQESYALFKAPAPPVSAPDTDLSQLRTARGLQIGSSYAKVLSLYGGSPKRGQRFVTVYVASLPATDFITNRHETLDEIVTLVIVADRVSSISIYIECCNE